MRLPNFLIIGAGSAGTTSLYYFLDQHPQIYMSPVKEPNFFAIDKANPQHRELVERYVSELSDYEALFAGVTDEKAVGEASTRYLNSLQAPQRIRDHIPDAKLIAILRHPVERAYSHFNRDRRDGLTKAKDFGSAIREGDGSLSYDQMRKPYIHAGFYYEQLMQYYQLFDESQIRVYLYEDLKRSDLEVVQDIFRFLDVDDTFVPNRSTRHNVSGTPRVGWLHRLLVLQNPVKRALNPVLPYWLRSLAISVKNLNLSTPTPMAPELRAELIDVYREDILKLQDLIRRDLSAWLT